MRIDHALRAGLRFSDMGATFRFDPSLEPSKVRLADHQNRWPGRLFAGSVGTWLIYGGPQNVVVAADPHAEPLPLAAAVSDTRSDLNTSSFVRIMLDLEEFCQALAHALDLPFAETFKTPSHAGAPRQS